MTSHFKHIVVADDDQEDVEMFKSAIDETCPDIKITVATNGENLIKLLHNIPKPDAIVLDMNMPLKNGKECLEEIRSQSQFNSIPIVMLSTSDQKAEMDYCLNNGALRYYIKPTSYSGLKTIVECICSVNNSRK